MHNITTHPALYSVTLCYFTLCNIKSIYAFYSVNVQTISCPVKNAIILIKTYNQRRSIYQSRKLGVFVVLLRASFHQYVFVHVYIAGHIHLET